MQTASAIINSKKDALKEKLKNTALSPEEREKYEKELSQWNAGGLLLNVIGAGLSAPTNSIGGIVAATASPIVSYQIGQYFKGKDAEGSTAHLVAHAVVGAAVAAAGGNNALAGGLAAAGTEALAPVVSKWLYGKESKDLTADEKATVSSIIGLAGAATGAAVGGSMADVAQGNQAGHTAVDNNALRNSKGESKLNTQEKILNEKLKKAGVQSADDYQRKYDACKTDQCRIQVEKEYLKASDEANKIILNLYMTGQITEEESKILLTSYANKMMRGAGESQRRFGSRIFDLNANEWIPASVIGNADFNQITMLNLVKKMKRSGASDEQIAIRVFQYQIAGSYIGSVSIMQQQVDTLLNLGVSVETVIRALSMKKGRRLTNDEIGLIKNRYSVMMQKQGSKAKAGKGTINQQYLEEMSKNGVKFSPENILKVEKLADGKIVFLEKGNSSAGLQHIVERHASDFAKIGVSESQIPNVVIDTVSKGKIIGYQGKGTGRPIYEITINGQKQRIAVTTGSNGFIVGANPAGSK
ncbi:hemagglutinin/hemolysin-related protein [Snodgrassella alvi wkB2]|uniref:VENN motif pre-toxin domain-containing protein n=3 Tax=Snodgrassella alvi TaxID=1196083 RepID=A0ABD7Z1Q1_9NEIS|nr:VENN motif pre-toxin domain-containing protein [Snodgrassella alvi]AHN29308.1 hemagglutinin/hemolysin-related protein [Snodgrassella alvi wkB2]ORF05173.1 hypothetical protein BGH96_02765 [Snodgrassella alvi]PIT44546.1 hypothetical protein BHC45_06645 [Snodgrassella alvi]WLS98383.1 VENN motif pre-toxin domain-containing protein [Snodgrassella alvi]